jgi:4-alpha-glucanotransferase
MYATFCTLAEQHPGPWQRWPAEYRDPASPAVTAFAERHRDRVRFHQWLQWLVDEQLGEAGRELPLVGDLAVGTDPGGADAWTWQDLYAEGMEVGAPPDEFNTQGQKWGLLPFVPGRLTQAGYEPFVRIVRSALRHMGGLRLDHVMGLFRLYWVPNGASPKDGVYVRYPALDLLDIVALESERAGAYIIGEDLGTVEDEVRRELAFRRSISYRVMWFERAKPAQYPVQALATVTTHDLPTIPGLWTGSDLEAQRTAGLSPNDEGTRMLKNSLANIAGAGQQTPVDEIVLRTYSALATAPSMLLSATLEDAIGFEPRPNMPGTIDEYPSWCIRLPMTIEAIEADTRPRDIARALTRKP